MLLRRLLAIMMVLGASPLAAQPVRVSGTVVNERGTPIQGATLRLTGADTTISTGPTGAFAFEGIFPNGMILTASAPGHDFRSIPLSPGSTHLTLTLKSKITTLDPMIVRPKRFRIKGQVLDAKKGESLIFARVSLYPDGRTVDANNVGDFRFDTVSAGPVTIVAEAMEHLPTAVQFNATRDTSIKIRLPVDSVAVRMLAQQTMRLQARSRSSEFTLRHADRNDIAREARNNILEMVEKIMVRPFNRRTLHQQSADEGCVFYDDRKIALGMLLGIYPELIERVEVYNRGAMIRVYSKRYVMSLMAQEQLRGIKYIRTGLGVICD